MSDNGAFPMHRLTPADQGHAARLLVEEVPELSDHSDPGALSRVLSDCVRRVNEESVRRSREVVLRELHRAKDEGREADVEGLAAQLTELSAQVDRLRGAQRTPV